MSIFDTHSKENLAVSNTDHDEGTPHKEGTRSFISEVLNFALVALLIVLPIRMFIAQPFIVSGASMETTFSSGEYLIVDQVSYRFEEPARGDVIVFRYPKDPSKFFIKRIIGIPGDTIHIDGSAVTLTNEGHPEGVVLDEPYIRTMAPNTTISETLGTDEYFVMGDNRNASSDSRMWGVLQRDKIVGRALLRLFPLGTVSVLPGSFDIEAHIINSEPAP
jgi:signal peptidase I